MLSELDNLLKIEKKKRMEGKILFLRKEIDEYDRFFQEDADIEQKFLQIFYQHNQNNGKYVW